MKIDVWPEDNVPRQTFFSSEAERVERSKLIQTNLSEPDVELFMNLFNCLIGLMKSSTFGPLRHMIIYC